MTTAGPEGADSMSSGEPIVFRLGKPGDEDQLASIHYQCVPAAADSFVTKLGPSFLRRYYRVLLAEPASLVLCALEGDRIVGFVCGSLEARAHTEELDRKKFYLFLPLLPRLLMRPSAFREMLRRRRAFSSNGSDNGYIVSSGPRMELWACMPSARSGGRALNLLQSWLAVAANLGARRIRFEVNQTEAEVSKLHKLMGAHPVKTLSTPDGKERTIFEYCLN